MEAEAASSSAPAAQHSSGRASAAEAQATRLADAVAARLAQLQSEVSACEAVQGGGPLWARKVEQAAEEAAQLQAGLARWHAQRSSSRRQTALEARSELFRRTGVRHGARRPRLRNSRAHRLVGARLGRRGQPRRSSTQKRSSSPLRSAQTTR